MARAVSVDYCRISNRRPVTIGTLRRAWWILGRLGGERPKHEAHPGNPRANCSAGLRDQSCGALCCGSGLVYVAQWFVSRVESSERATAARLRSSFRFYPGSSHVVALILLLLAITTLVLQAPVGGLLFAGEPARANGTGLRFFYLPIFLTFVAAWSVIPLSPKARARGFGLYVLAFATTLAACLFAWKTHNTNAQIAQQATLVRADVSQLVTRFKQVAGSRDEKKDRCVIFGESLAQNIRETSLDLVIKAHLPANDPRANCLLITNPPQYLSLTRVRPCSNSYLEPDLKSAYSRQPLYRLGTCTFLGPTAK